MEHYYIYKGLVMEFDRCIANNWYGKTKAPSEAKARSNLTYQFKKQLGKLPRTKINLPGKIILEGASDNGDT